MFRGSSLGLFLEHFHKSWSVAESDLRAAVFLVFGFVSAQFVSPSPASRCPLFAMRLRAMQSGFSNLRLRQSLAHNQKSPLRLATSFLSML
jgi:hypothetical protein